MFDALETDKLASLRRDLAVPVFDIGPLHVHSPAASRSLLQQDRGCVDWLDAQGPASVLYISFGSLASMPAAALSCGGGHGSSVEERRTAWLRPARPTSTSTSW
jgi:hypothetical protein